MRIISLERNSRLGVICDYDVVTADNGGGHGGASTVASANRQQDTLYTRSCVNAALALAYTNDPPC